MSNPLAHLEGEQDDRPSAYWEGDKAVFRSSAIGGCDKELIGLLMGMDPLPNAPWMQAIFDLGHELEPYVIQAARLKTGYAIEGSQHQVEFDVAGKAVVRSHLDGLAFDATDEWTPLTEPSYIVEAKGLGKTYMKAYEEGRLFDEMPTYAWQISVQMHELGLPVMYVVFDKRGLNDGGKYPWEMSNEELVAATHIEYITEPPISKGEIRKKALSILSAANNGDLPVDCPIRNGLCSTPYLHEDGEDHSALEEFEAQRNIEEEDQAKVSALASTYAKARAAEQRAKAAKKEASAKLKDYLDELCVNSVDAGDFKVTTVHNKGRKKVNRKALNAFLAEHGKKYDDFQELGEGYSYTKVTEREVDEDVA